MHRLRPGRLTTVVVACALGSSIAWLFFLFWYFSVDQRALLAAGSMGVATLVGAGAGALFQSWSSRSSSEHLAKAEHDARHDALTGLFNRIALFDELEWSHQRAKEADTILGVLFLDLDRFKVINDSMGHEAGDELLRIVATRIQSAVRGSDIVARFGGDEFVVVCRDLLSERSVLAVADQILASFAKPVSLYGGAQVISTSIGVAIARPDDARRPEDLVRDADAAMYKAKRDRSGYALFDEAQRLQVIDRLDIERDLVKALDEEQLTVFYQPLVNVSERRLYGFEALVRWHHPTRGIISPADFLPVAEETGMMGRIGELVLREACAQAAVWNHISSDARSIKMSVNIAEQQLLDAHFPHLVSEVLVWSGLPAEQLVLEIIEDVIVDHLDGLNMLRDIRAMGVGLAIDDFGTGQSSLSYIKQFDMVSVLKIDKSFIDEMAPGSPNRAIIEAIIAMANALDLAIVAEGVETNEQTRELMSLGVDVMQGYLFNKPVRADAIDPAVWFASRGHEPVSRPGLTPLEVSRSLAEPDRPSAVTARPARRG